MSAFQLVIELRSPTCIAQRPTAPGQIAETASYLSGTAVRAALAELWLGGRSYAELDEAERADFAELFMGEAVTFGNALPLHPKQKPVVRSRVVPRSAWSTRLRPGWSTEGDGVRDALAALLGPADLLDELERAGLDPLGDEYRFAYEVDGSWTSIRPARRLLTRVALSTVSRPQDQPVRGTAADGLLYSLIALETGQCFAAQISGPDAAVAALSKLVPDAGVIVHLGQGRSRGLGAARARVFDAPPDRPRPPAELLALAREFSRRAGAADGDLLLPITLEADAILRDDYLLPCASGEPGTTLFRYQPATPAVAGMELVEALQQTRWLGGWDALRRVPRPPQLAVSMGSVWVYRLRPADDGAALAAIDWWLRAERDGIGERRGEDFGRVRLLHPLHCQKGVL